MNYEIRRVNGNTYDVFMGNQWDNWSRVRQGRSSAHVQAGAPLPHGVLKHLNHILDARMPINYNQPHATTITNCFQHI